MGLTGWWRRGKAAGSGVSADESTALGTARRAQEDTVREQAQQQVLELGEMLGHSPVERADRGNTFLARALDAYEAAGKVLDHARDIPDLAGVLVLVREGRQAIAAAAAVERGASVPAVVPLCFFNPLHGVSARHVTWRPIGQWLGLTVRACDECAKRVKRRSEPDALRCHVHGRDIPYYEVDPEHSVWAATGYGQLRDDLIERVLAGEFPHDR